MATDIQSKLILRDDLVSLQDGLHNLIETPAFTAALTQAIASYFGPIFEPDLIESLKRFLAQGRRNDSRSYSIRTAALGGPIRILERDESRILALISNLGAQTVFVGGRQVTVGAPNDASGGLPIPANNYPPLILTANIGELWAITGTDGQDLRVLDIAGGL